MQPKSKNSAKMAQVKDLVSKIKSGDAEERTEAWLSAGGVGPAAIKPLARVAVDGELEVARAANRAMWKIVRTAGAPQGSGKKQAVKMLAGLLGDEAYTPIKRDVLWMLSEISDGGDEIEAIAAALDDEQCREDARAALERIPGNASLAALKAAFKSAPEEFKYALAESLRRRGAQVDGYPSQKMEPVKATKVKPVGRA